MDGGTLIGEFLHQNGVQFLFTLCGGHISPILAGSKRAGIRVIDTRHEATAVFAADAVARLTGKPGVAAVTAGPGVTNSVTAIKNARIAQSPLILLGGATATALKGRGALQDIDQMALMQPHVKWATSVKRVKDIIPALKKALQISQSQVPGPVFVELPVDLLYQESLVRELYLGQSAQSPRSVQGRVLNWYLRRHVRRLFSGMQDSHVEAPQIPQPTAPAESPIHKAHRRLASAKRPLMILGSQVTLLPSQLKHLISAIETLGLPVYLSGMARGLLGRNHPLHIRHKRREALKEADLVILVGVPCDFRLDYGKQIPRSAVHIGINRSKRDLYLNKPPTIAIQADPCLTLIRLSALAKQPNPQWNSWLSRLKERDQQRDAEIEELAAQPTEGLNPLHLLKQMEEHLPENSIIVGDGGDFVASASYILRPRRPLSWLDPGPFGTLGVGAGFALGSKLVHPESKVWIIYGDGAAAYSLMEFDTFVRHNLSVIAVVGNDGAWMQIAREQVEILKDDVGTVLMQSDYHKVAEAFGARGAKLDSETDISQVLQEAKEAAENGVPFLINAIIGKTQFRKGSISM